MFKKISKFIPPIIVQAFYLASPALVLAANTDLVPGETIGQVDNIVLVVRLLCF